MMGNFVILNHVTYSCYSFREFHFRKFYSFLLFFNVLTGTSLVVQRLRLRTPNAGGPV